MGDWPRCVFQRSAVGFEMNAEPIKGGHGMSDQWLQSQAWLVPGQSEAMSVDKGQVVPAASFAQEQGFYRAN